MKSILIMVLSLSLTSMSYGQEASVPAPKAKKTAPKEKKGNDLAGYQMLNDNDDIYVKLGIQKGDVVKSFDGTAVVTAHQAMELYKNMTAVGTHEVEVERNGKIEKIRFEIKRAFKVIK